jgi:hypothetical protein
MDYDVRVPLLRGLVRLLRPAKEDLLPRPELLDGMYIMVQCIVQCIVCLIDCSVQFSNHPCHSFTVFCFHRSQRSQNGRPTACICPASSLSKMYWVSKCLFPYNFFSTSSEHDIRDKFFIMLELQNVLNYDDIILVLCFLQVAV